MRESSYELSTAALLTMFLLVIYLILIAVCKAALEYRRLGNATW